MEPLEARNFLYAIALNRRADMAAFR